MDSTARFPTGVFALGTAANAVSAIARTIGLLGVPMVEGPDDGPPPMQEGRGPARRAPGAMNRRIVERLGGSPLAPPVPEDGWPRRPGLERPLLRARTAFLTRHQTLQWVWGDPLLSLLLPFWTDAVDVRPIAIIAHGQPLDASPMPEGGEGAPDHLVPAIWERYARAALRSARGLPTLVTRPETLADSPGGWARAAAPFLEAQGLRLSPTTEPGGLERLDESVLTEGLAGRSRSPDEGERLSDAQRRLAATLDSLVGAHDALPEVTLPDETKATERLLRGRRRSDMAVTRSRRARRRRRREGQADPGSAGREQTERGPGVTAQTERDPGGTERTERRPAGTAQTEQAAESAGQSERGTEAPPEPGLLPHYLILGAQKAGTSSLYRYIGESPAVELPVRKEIHYFDVQHDRGAEWYRSQFPPARPGAENAAVTGEGSPYYLFHPLAPGRVRDLLPDVRLLVLVRDPVRRAVSNYHHEVRAGRETLPLEAALDAEPERLAGEAERLVAEPGYASYNHRHYAYQAAAWRAVFPAEQLLVIQSERLFEDPDREMQRVFEFLELPAAPPTPFRGGRAYPRPPTAVQERLATHFAPHNARLYELLGEDLGW
jgi:hypothetical protein